MSSSGSERTIPSCLSSVADTCLPGERRPTRTTTSGLLDRVPHTRRSSPPLDVPPQRLGRLWVTLEGVGLLDIEPGRSIWLMQSHAVVQGAAQEYQDLRPGTAAVNASAPFQRDTARHLGQPE